MTTPRIRPALFVVLVHIVLFLQPAETAAEEREIIQIKTPGGYAEIATEEYQTQLRLYRDLIDRQEREISRADSENIGLKTRNMELLYENKRIQNSLEFWKMLTATMGFIAVAAFFTAIYFFLQD